MPGLRSALLWDRLRYCSTRLTKGGPCLQKLFLLVSPLFSLRNWHGKAKSLCTEQHSQEFLLDGLEKEIALLEKEFSENQEIGFCHNDLQYGNIMFDEKTRSIIIIVSLCLRCSLN